MNSRPLTLKQFQNRKIEAWDEHAARFSCEHEETELRRRTISGGQNQFVQQCMQCGDARSQPIAKAKALQLSGSVEPPDFDNELKQNWERRKQESVELIKKAFNGEVFHEGYGEYLNSEAWAKRRKLVLNRARGTCEGCGEAAATEVHHTSYEHVGNEFLFELVALCEPCHDRFHHADEE
jgi:hypothetical protein